MLQDRYQQLCARLSSYPGEPGDWLELGRWSRRLDQVPDFLGPDHLPDLLEAWIDAPRDRCLLPLFLRAAGLELADPTEPPPWWRHSRLRRGDEGEWYDRELGLPLRVSHPRSGQELLWVPSSGPSLELGSYLARHPQDVAGYQAFLSATNRPAPSDHRERIPWFLQGKRPGRPVVFVSHHDAEAFCAWAGGALPESETWTRAARGNGSRRFPWGDRPPDPTRANSNQGRPWRGGDWDRFLRGNGERPAGASPFGLEDMVGQVREWTAERIRVERHWRARVRGGAWGTSRPEFLAIDNRDDLLEVSRREDDVGFRLALPLLRRGPLPDPVPVPTARTGRRRRRRRRKRR